MTVTRDSRPLSGYVIARHLLARERLPRPGGYEIDGKGFFDSIFADSRSWRRDRAPEQD